MRAFIALELPKSFFEETSQLAHILSTHVKGRFLPSENYHITLAFLGDINEEEAIDTIDVLKRVCQNREQIFLSCEGLGIFGKKKDATLWLGLKENVDLNALSYSLREELLKCGIDFDKKDFRAHITLARRANLAEIKELPHLPFPQDAMANKITLFKSTLTQQGAVYKPLYTIEMQC